ncbi:MAG: hypothetical protein ABFQ95_01170 [Pseudomonadota bacterium]
MSTAFLPHDYEPPRSNSSYMKLQDGENKIRILSSPVLGWEEWIDNKPVRYNYDQKPDKWFDSERPGRHFWAFIVWNYKEERIQIFHVTQASIRKELESLVRDDDWGDPFFYDVKINRSGKDLKTKYSVNPLPHKVLADHVQQAFEDHPCNLEALIMGEDPFGHWDHYTPGVFSKDDLPERTAPETITVEQLNEINEYIGDDKEYLKKVLSGAQKMFGIDKLAQIPSDKYESVLKSVKLHAKERAEKEVSDKVIPF